MGGGYPGFDRCEDGIVFRFLSQGIEQFRFKKMKTIYAEGDKEKDGKALRGTGR